MSTQVAIQLLVLVVVLIAMGMTVRYWMVHRAQWPYTIPPLSWLVHLVIFYGLFFARYYGVPSGIAGFTTGLDFTFWSAIIRLQAAFLILGVMTMLAYDRLFFKA